MVCSYRYSCLELPVALVDCQMKGYESRLHHFYQGGYVALHDINIDGAELNICCGFVDDIWMGGKHEKLKKLQHRTVYRTDKSEDDKEEEEGTVIGCGGEDVSIVTVVYPRGTVSVSSLVDFLSVGSSSKPYHPSLPVSVVARHIQEYFKKKRGRKRKFINTQQEKARHEERMKRGKVIVREKLIVGYWELIPMELVSYLLAPQDTPIVRVTGGRREEKKQRNYWWTEDN